MCGGRVSARCRVEDAVNDEPVVQQKAGAAATVGQGQVEAPHAVVQSAAGRPVPALVEFLLTCAGEIDRVVAVQDRLRLAAVPRRSTTTKPKYNILYVLPSSERLPYC